MFKFKTIKLLKKTYDSLLNDVSKKYDLTLNQIKILIYLNERDGDIFAKNIVEDLGFTKSHISMSINELQKKHLIIRKKASDDKKKLHLILTDKSYKIIKDALELKEELNQIISKGISKEELETFIKISDKLSSNLEEYNKNKIC